MYPSNSNISSIFHHFVKLTIHHHFRYNLFEGTWLQILRKSHANDHWTSRPMYIVMVLNWTLFVVIIFPVSKTTCYPIWIIVTIITMDCIPHMWNATSESHVEPKLNLLLFQSFLIWNCQILLIHRTHLTCRNRVKFRRICMESSEHNWGNVSELICPEMLVFGK